MVQLSLAHIPNLLIGTFYCPPHSSTSYITELANSFERISPTTPVILCGDFNAADIDWDDFNPSSSSPVGHMLCDILQDHSLEQLVKTPTRNQNILDLLLTNQTGILEDIVFRWTIWIGLLSKHLKPVIVMLTQYSACHPV